jgi:hypothetical protein
MQHLADAGFLKRPCRLRRLQMDSAALRAALDSETAARAADAAASSSSIAALQSDVERLQVALILLDDGTSACLTAG